MVIFQTVVSLLYAHYPLFFLLSYIEDIQFFLNMAFISSSEVENIYIS